MGCNYLSLILAPVSDTTFLKYYKQHEYDDMARHWWKPNNPPIATLIFKLDISTTY